jgi:hypothetical protein
MISLTDFRELIKKWNIAELRRERAAMINQKLDSKKIELIDKQIEKIEREGEVRKKSKPAFGKRHR